MSQILELLAIDDWRQSLDWAEAHPGLIQNAYGFSKECAQVFTLLQAAPLAKHGIRINSVCPGLIDTPLIADFQTSMGTPILDWMTSQSGGRKAAPAEVADALAFLGSDAASYINGTNLLIDNGFSDRLLEHAGCRRVDQLIGLTVLACPDAMNRHNSSIEIVVSGLHMPECPRWHDEHLWFSDIRGDTVHRVDDGRVSVVHRFPDGEEPAGLGWLPNGDLLAAGMAKRVIYRVSGGHAAVHADVKRLAPHQINDMIVTSDGTAFVTQLGFDLDAPQPAPQPTVVIRVGLDGTVSTAAEDLMVPNGIAVDDAERSLVVAESGAARLTRFALRDGVLSNRIHESLPATAAVPFCAPDGICLDEQGGRWVADSINKRIIRVHYGVITDEHLLDRYVLACVLGDHDRRSLYVCVTDAWHKSETCEQPTGHILRFRVTVPGVGRP